MQRLTRNLVASLAVAIAFPTTQLMATVVLPNLPPGTQYELVFVTLDAMSAGSPDITTYNTFVSNEASLSPSIAALHATWHAIASTATVNAIVNAPDNGIAVYNTKGIEVATAATGIYDSGLLSPVQYNQFGNSQSSNVWTGTNVSGAAVPNGQFGNDNDVEQGLSSSSDGHWIFDNNVFQSVNSFPLYALSSPITVVPEPATITLLGSALLVIGWIRLIRKRRRQERVGLLAKA